MLRTFGMLKLVPKDKAAYMKGKPLYVIVICSGLLHLFRIAILLFKAK